MQINPPLLCSVGSPPLPACLSHPVFQNVISVHLDKQSRNAAESHNELMGGIGIGRAEEEMA